MGEQTYQTIKTKVLKKICKPVMGRTGDAAFDLKAAKNFSVYPGGTAIVPLGVAFRIPSTMCGILTHRSSLAFQFGCTASHGLIDSSFNSEVKACIINHSEHPVCFKAGDRICQIRFVDSPMVSLVEDNFNPDGKEGFGSSGGYANVVE